MAGSHGIRGPRRVVHASSPTPTDSARPHDCGDGGCGRDPAGLSLCRSQIQPASLDLRLGDIAYRVRASFLPGPERGSPSASRNGDARNRSRPGAVLETDCVYLVPLLERLELPPAIVGGRQPEKLHRPARRLHPGDHRWHAQLRPDRRWLSRPALCRDQPADLSAAVARGFAPVASCAFAPATPIFNDNELMRSMKRRGWSIRDADIATASRSRSILPAKR